MVVGWRATVSGARGVLAGDAACSLAMRSSARFPASHFNRHRHQQIVEGGFKGGRDSEGGGKAAPRFGAGNLEPIRVWRLVMRFCRVFTLLLDAKS